MDVVTLAELCTMIYFSLDPKKYIEAHEAEFKVFDLDTELAYFRTGPNEVLVVYKGSCTIVDWQYNIKFWKNSFVLTQDKKIKVHHGMNEKIKDAYEFLKKRIKPTDNVYLTGHSLGGSLSLLTAYALKKNIGCNIEGVYCFGAPPVGNKAWKDAYDPILRDVTHDYMVRGDWVSFLPLKCVGYHAVGLPTIWLDVPSYFPSWLNKHLPWSYVASIRATFK